MAKSYLESLLAHQEKIELVARQHWFTLLRSIILEIVVIVILIPLVILLRDFLTWWNRQYVLTNRRVIQISGTFNKRVTDSSLEKVNDVKMVQSFFGRLFNFGDLEILTASEAGIDKLSWLADPIRFKTTMLDAKEQMDRD